MNEDDNPLGEHHYQQIVTGLATAERALRNIARAKLAGIDMSVQEAQIKDTQARLLQVKSVYFPGR